VITDEAVPDTAAQVQINLSGGKSLEAAHDLADPIPLPRREEKVRSKAASLLGADMADSLWHDVAGGRDTATGWIAKQNLY
jgi:hypothetical protein